MAMAESPLRCEIDDLMRRVRAIAAGGVEMQIDPAKMTRA